MTLTFLSKAVRNWLILFAALCSTPIAAQDVPPALSVYGELPRVEDATISETGAYLAFLATVRGERTILVLDSELKAVRNFPVGDTKVRSIRFVGDESLLLIHSQTEDLGRTFAQDQFEFYQALVMPMDPASEIVRVFSSKRKIVNADGTRIAEGRNPDGNAGFVGLGNDGNTVIYRAELDDRGETPWYEVPLDGSAAPVEFLPDVDTNRTYWDQTSGRLLGYLEGGSTPTPVFFNRNHQSAVEKIMQAFPQQEMRMVEWTPDFSHVLVRTSGNGDAGSWFYVDVENLSAKFVAGERPLIPSSQVGPVSTVEYEAGDGLKMDGILTLPPGREAQNLPVIMLPHGGPHARDREQFDWLAQSFASRGYAVFQPNFRGSTNRGEAFVRAGYGEWGRKMQTDISDGLAELAEAGIVDPDRACIVGASYGGYAALAGVTLQQGLYRCAVSVAGVSDLKLLKSTERDQSGRSRLTRRSLEEEFGPNSGLDDVSPYRFADRADAPVLLIHGRNDTVVEFQQSYKMADALDDAGKPHELIELEEEDHWLSRSPTRLQMLDATMQFVLEHNPPD